ncbi:hypothetical protein IHV12_04140 [Fictibacillus sp. 7GRE50]|uniref:hypothetical protein n=1 Tax=Fictibacillus sp. 7GRE50 TaxID=2745878 RepID=UPI0018CFBB70|nr:hypothetical protein [Fictibacillus sp. 7GRE50]MBH0164090.1 hypothetical protein [Fictibacillus sp. 7GRE50]
MPYGFIKHIENKEYSSESTKSYEKVLNQFFSYLNYIIADSKEPLQISSGDINYNLTNQQAKKVFQLKIKN